MAFGFAACAVSHEHAARQADVSEARIAGILDVPGSFDVDEWGLVDVDLASGRAELSAGPGRPARPMIARKPALYFHLLAGSAATLSVVVRVPGGTLLESFPPGESTDDGIRWRSIVLHDYPCSRPLAVPSVCASRDF